MKAVWVARSVGEADLPAWEMKKFAAGKTKKAQEMTNIKSSACRKIFLMYVDGFRSMTLGKTLWKIIVIKLLIIFGVLRLFFFTDFLNSNFATEDERASYVLENISKPAMKHQKGG
jgi:hypothetical protein